MNQTTADLMAGAASVVVLIASATSLWAAFRNRALAKDIADCSKALTVSARAFKEQTDQHNLLIDKMTEQERRLETLETMLFLKGLPVRGEKGEANGKID